MRITLRKNLTLILTLAALVALLGAAAAGMERKDFVITLLRGLAVGSLTFLVASGFSLIFGLLDVLNLAHGTLFMIGAYVGWTVYVRPDTFVDLLPPLALLSGGFMLLQRWPALRRGGWARWQRRVLGAVMLALGLGLIAYILPRYPVAVWNVEDYAQSPISLSYLAGQGQLSLPPPPPFDAIVPWLALTGLVAAGALSAGALALWRTAPAAPFKASALLPGALLLAVGLLTFFANDALTGWLVGLNSNLRFLLAVVAAVGVGVGLGALMEIALIRPLYVRPIYQLMLTLGLSAIGVEVVRAVWGRPEFTMPRPALFAGTGEGCPAHSLADWWRYHCSTMLVLDGRIRVYNEIFIPLVGVLVLVAIWVLLQRSRLGMIIRAGVQDREMVEALGINVQRVFTRVFALGVGLAALGGVLAAPSIGLSNMMGESFLLNALIALAIGGLTSYPGAAFGSLLVGLVQQFVIKYGQIGISIPLLDAVFKPSPPLVPASTLLLMVVVLLILPNGLLGRRE